MFDPVGAAVGLLEEFISSEQLADSGAWGSGIEIDDDEIVEAQLSSSAGAYPHRVVNAVYRRFVQRRMGFDSC
jgi:hypothetical protein